MSAPQVGARNRRQLAARTNEAPELKRASAKTERLLRCLLLVALAASGARGERPPSITRQPQDVVTFEGEAAELSCEASGEPQPRVEWFHEERALDSRALSSLRARVSLDPSSNALRFRELRAPTSSELDFRDSVEGQYHCVASNALGQARSRNATLKILAYRTGGHQQQQQVAANSSRQQQQSNLGDLVAVGAISLLDPQLAARVAEQQASARTGSRFQVDSAPSGRLVDRIATPEAADQPQNKLDYIIEFMRQNRLTKFCDLLTGAQPEVRDLNRRLNAMHQFTLFVPTNEAMLLMPSGLLDQITRRPEDTRQFLLAHATGSLVMPRLEPSIQREVLAASRWSTRGQLMGARSESAAPSSARASSTLVQSLAGTQLRVTTSTVMAAANATGAPRLELIVNGANVLSGHSHALQEPNNANLTYAIVHLIDRPLYPSPSASLAAKLRQLAPRMAKYVELAQDPALNEVLESSQRLSTLFLPGDDSFKLVPAELLAQLDANRTFLLDFLRSHLLEDLYYSAQLGAYPQSKRLSAMSNLELEFEVKSLPSRSLILVNSIPIVEADNVAINGVAHLIARPILARSIVDDCNCTSPLANATLRASVNLDPLAPDPNRADWTNSAAIASNELEREESRVAGESRQSARVRSSRSGGILIERNNRDFYRPSVVPANLQLSGSQRSQQIVASPADASRRQDQDLSREQVDELNRLLASSGNSSVASIGDSLFEAERYKVLNASTRQQLREQQEWQNYTRDKFAYDQPLATPTSATEDTNSPSKRLYSEVGATNSTGSSVDEKLMLKFAPEDARDLQPTSSNNRSQLAQPAYETITGDSSRFRPPAAKQQFSTGKTVAPPSGFGGCAFYDADCKRLVSKLVRLPPTKTVKSSLLTASASTSPSVAVNRSRVEQHLDSTFGETVTESPFSFAAPKTFANQKPAPARVSPHSQPLLPWSDDDIGKLPQPTILAAGGSSWNHRQPATFNSDIARIQRQQQQLSSSVYLSGAEPHGHGFTGGLSRVETSKPAPERLLAAANATKSQFPRQPSAQILLVPVRLLQNSSTSGAAKPAPPQLTGAQLISEKPIYFSPPLSTIRLNGDQQRGGLNGLLVPQSLPEITIHSGDRLLTARPSLGRLTNFTAIETVPADEPIVGVMSSFQSSSSAAAKSLLLRAPVATQRKSRLQDTDNSSITFGYQPEQQQQLTSPARKIVRLQPSPPGVWPTRGSGEELGGDISITSAKLASQTGATATRSGGGLAVQASNQAPNAISGGSNVVRSAPFDSSFADPQQQAQDFFQNRTIAEIMDDSGLRIDGQQVTFSRLKECLRDANLLNLVTQVGSSLTIFMPTDLAFQRLVQQQVIAHQAERSAGGRSARLLDSSRRHLIPLVARLRPLSPSTNNNLVDELSGRLTFDPIDAASATTAAERLTLDCSTSQVRQLLLDHLSARLVTPKQLQSDTILNSLNGRHQLLLSSVPSKKIVVVDGQPVIAATRAKNGMVYVVNKFLNLTQQVPNVIDAIESQPNLTTFLSYLTFSSLSERLKRDTGPLTVLAPTNEAFEQLSASARQLINSDPAALMDILRGHVVEGAQFGKLVPMRNRLRTMNSDQLIDAKVIKPNVYQLDNQVTSMRLIGTTGNGVVNAIDRLIVPPWLKISMNNQQRPSTTMTPPSSTLDPSRIMSISANDLSSSFAGESDSSLATPNSSPASLNLPLIGRQPTRFEQPAGSRLVAPPSGISATNSFLFNHNSSGAGNNLFDSFDVPEVGGSSGSSSPFLKLANSSAGGFLAPVSMANATRNMQLIGKLANLMQARKFVDYLVKSRVSSSLKPDMNYVILVPTDQAIEKLPRQIIEMLERDQDRLLDLINYHILDTTFEYINTIPDGQTLNTLNEKDILFNWHRNNTVLTASGAVVLGGIQEDNIALLIVDRVLYPTPGDILNIISKSPILSNFTALVRQTGLQQQLSMAGPHTLFAPSDFAFNQLDKRDLQFLQQNRETARRFLLRHLSQPAIFTSSIALSNTTEAAVGNATTGGLGSLGGKVQLPTMTISNSLGEELTLRQRNDYFSVNDVNFSYADVAATNGVVHVIDGLL